MSVDRLTAVLSLINTTSLKKFDDYYRGDQPLAYLSPEVKAEVGDRIPEIVLNVPRVVVGSIEERLNVLGFRVGTERKVHAKLATYWRANDLDEWSQLCHIEALKHGIAFVTVWSDDDNPEVPRIAVESAHQMAVEFAPGTRRVVAAAKRWQDTDDDGKPVVRAVLYLPDAIEYYVRPGGLGVAFAGDPVAMPSFTAGGWAEFKPATRNPLGEVPVVPFINRPSLTDMSGESEIADVMSLTDGVNKLLSDMLVTSEYHAEPKRYATGIQVPREAAAKGRLQAEAAEAWDDAKRGKTLIGGAGVQFGQLAAADLNNFKTGVDLLLSKISLITGLPPADLGIVTENPASAESRRVALERFSRRTKRKQTHFGGSWERVAELALKVQGEELPEYIETWWESVETPTFNQDADAIQKLTAGDRPVITIAAGREILGFSPEQIEQMDNDARDASANAATADVEARMAQARDLVARDGLSLNAAMAAVGLIAAANANAVTPATGAQSAPGQ